MMEEQEIINRVANSVLQVFDLEDYYPEGERKAIDISEWLLEGFVLREKDFRATLKNHDWEQYKGCYVALYCSTDAIVPAWAYMLVSTYLQPVAKKVIQGSIANLNVQLYQDILSKIDYTEYSGKPVIVKGCSRKPVPQEAYVMAVQKLMPYAKSLMFGEACSAVPLYKNK
ncbi:DUF2480 family protein [Flavobacterium salilacus subsp. salilacus]|uniref:DUF2480 family protein n=1 Tax=Flavobacterium TaxID=237 RepID=UPI001074CBFC|nr:MULTISPECIES: DUF2480 family protein [Flavobacterium]KAF2519058.1 DUF2480 family protein [Flavobacterium salilacus subsp. salilacus]MBE1614776.1 DUF2480 family protein [Flavobacterium sp. SaA2.13]